MSKLSSEIKCANMVNSEQQQIIIKTRHSTCTQEYLCDHRVNNT